MQGSLYAHRCSRGCFRDRCAAPHLPYAKDFYQISRTASAPGARRRYVLSEPLIIAGFHQSGTSLVARLLHRAGLFLGYELLGAHPSNPQGHFGDREVLELHQRILAYNERDMFVTEDFRPEIREDHRRAMRRISEQRNSEHSLWGFEEPRASFFLEDWKWALPPMKVLVVYRHFSGATHSLARRHAAEIFSGRGSDFDRQLWKVPDLALRSWLSYNEALLSFVSSHPEDTMMVSLDTVRDGFPLVPALNRRWGLELESAPMENLGPTTLDGRPLRQPVYDRRLIPRVKRAWRALEALGQKTDLMVDEMYG